MSLRVGAAVSTELDPLTGAAQAAAAAAAGLGGAEADIVFVFASGAHLTAPEATLQGVQAELAPAALIGCGAGGVLGSGRELESGTAVAVWAAALDGGSARTFHASVREDDDAGVLEGCPSWAPRRR